MLDLLRRIALQRPDIATARLLDLKVILRSSRLLLVRIFFDRAKKLRLLFKLGHGAAQHLLPAAIGFIARLLSHLVSVLHHRC
mmetsp:Transcript_45937/g.60881  ORF Transcript_45937/g.60881 Transcript_45937/m.60881 type:complete len:83 (-) Transcript_45937:1603-1851(-)